ncbi:EF-hand domain-containing family member C2-like isoform X2 [Ptychodera flava]|uniref:EF-hand domain-containing family member C2-like isoform X2 n=1 Tax=Ptychodera flava TaxID=63121 RepID=UPI00396A4F75
MLGRRLTASMPSKTDDEVDSEQDLSQSLPFLPGYYHPLNSRHIARENYRKSQHFDYTHGVPQWVGTRKPGIGGQPLLGQKPRSRQSQLPQVDRSVPKWIAYDKKILVFDAYFKEPEFMSTDRYKIRKCKIKFFLADDTIQVVELETRNSGMTQGRFLSKHRIRKPPPNEHEFYTADDLNVGQDVTFYDRTFHLTGCDKFTKEFFEDMDIKVNTPEKAPDDPYQRRRDREFEAYQSRRPYQSSDTLKQFLEYDRQVLRFHCYWDDSDTLYGDKREMILLYYLADDTIEVREVLPPNSGRELMGRTFLHRSRVPRPKGDYFLPKLGDKNAPLVLNVLGSGRHQRLLLDNSYPGPNYHEHYRDSDLIIGKTVNVWGRKFYLYDCDEYTKEHFKSKYGISTPKRVKRQLEYPPYNGYGTDEDSRNNCYPSPLILKRTERDYHKFVAKDKEVMRFSARMETTNENHTSRRFIISYYLGDDTISIYEPPNRNSGIVTGKFLERGRVKKPNQNQFTVKPVEYYTASDLYVGAHVRFNYHEFYIMDADEFTLKYMEKNRDEFPMADIRIVMEKLHSVASTNVDEVKKFFTKYDYRQSGKVPFELFRSLLIKVAGDELTDHEILTVARQYRVEEVAETTLDSILLGAHNMLRKQNFDSFRKIETVCFHRDIDRKGYLYPEQVKSVCHSLKVPLTDDIMDDIWSKMTKDDRGRIDYNDFIKLINWRDNPMSGAQGDFTKLQQQKRAASSVDYKEVMDYLYGE